MAERLGTDPDQGLTEMEAARRLEEHGPNQLQSEPPPSRLQIAGQQVLDPINLMLIGVAVVSILIGEISTGVFVGVLVLLNIGLGTRQELKATAAVDALAPSRCLRSGW